MSTYTQLPTVDDWVDCNPAYSFYFDFIHKLWKTQNSNYLPLHRICTLARKQGAASLIIETAFGVDSVDNEVTYLDKSQGSGGAAEAVKVTFFRECDHSHDISKVPEDAVIGQVIFVNYRRPNESDFGKSYVFEAIFHPPRLPAASGGSDRLLNNFVRAEKQFDFIARGRTFGLKAIYYCQQNSITHVCAHACLRMALNTISSGQDLVSGESINTSMNIQDPDKGLNVKNIVDFIAQSGQGHAIVHDCNGRAAEHYVSIIASHVQSGHATLLVFTTATQVGSPPEEHVVYVSGYTHNTDEWHPQAIPAYSGPASAPYRQSSLWIDHFVIHDDNFGPYYTLSARALEVDKNVKARWVIAIAPENIIMNAVGAELASSTVLKNLLRSLATLASNQWFDYITTRNNSFVLRPILIEKQEYLAHLLASKGHDSSAIDQQSLDKFKSAPEYFWMVEFSMPSLYTGNHTKLGEVIIDAFNVNPASLVDSVLFMRLPGLVIDFKTPGGASWSDFPMTSHTLLYNKNSGAQPEW